MKYIRTTDGRIINTQDERGKLIGESIVKINNSLIVVKNNKGNELIPIEDIVNQADTIEELCDEFVFICEDFNKPQLVIPMNFDYCKKEFNHTEIYGSIWTEWGLKYVAKMNEKGELELL